MSERGPKGVTPCPDGDGIDVLHLDDDEPFLTLTERWLQTEHEAIEVISTTDPGEAMSLLREEPATDGGAEVTAATRTVADTDTGAGHDPTVTDPPVDCVVSDYDMPGTDGLEFLEQVREHYPDLPFVLFTGKGSEEIASEAISAGVTDYLQKGTGGDRFTVLANRIENAVNQRRAERQAERSAERVRQVFDRITDAFVATDRDLRYTYANDRAIELLDTDREELLGTAMLDAFPEVEGTPFLDAFERAMREQEPVTAEDYFDPLDAWFEIRVFPARDGLSVYFRDVTERKERERRFNAIFNNTFQFTGLMKPDGTLVEANETAVEFAGVDSEDVLGRHLAETAWITEGNRDRIYDAAERAADGEFVRFEMEINGAEGPAIIDFSLKPVTDDRGEVTLLIPEGRDITDLKERERELREERAFAESIFAGLPDALYAFDHEGTFLRWNDRLVEVTGYDDAEVAEMHPLDFIPEDEQTKVAENIAAVVQSGETVTVESFFETKGGERIPYEFTGAPLVDQDGTELGLVGIGRDVTERREREREFEAVFNNTFQFTGLMEPDGTLVKANDTALAFGGVEPEDVIGKKVWNTHWFQVDEATPERVRQGVQRAREDEFVRYELEVQGAEGTAIIDFSLKPVTDEDGEVVLIVPEGRDITDLKERERELERKNERLEAFASVVSHDLKNPLGVAKANLELFRTGGSESLELVDEAESALDRMERLVEDLLELAEKGRIVDDPEQVDLGPAIHRALSAVEAGDLALRFDGTDRTVAADPERLVQLLENLLVNAVEHAEQEVRIGVEADGHAITVADDGPGVPPDDRERVFEPGYSTSEDGHGFGLAIARNIAEAHGWSLEVTGSDLGGARFVVGGLEAADGDGTSSGVDDAGRGDDTD
ncbi:PAS domain-containing protein [Haloglomus litoreum]|uniref:PAS domain-containing protein n=1 Tax=Haloglomus litoreum TaxID=3034026 RepID=UPI0023E8C886|nr:PAS domain-containing protein [Haloglomus sp. DT116]